MQYSSASLRTQLEPRVDGTQPKGAAFAEMKGGKTDTESSVSCTCLVYFFALLTINCFPNLC